MRPVVAALVVSSTSLLLTLVLSANPTCSHAQLPSDAGTEPPSTAPLPVRPEAQPSSDPSALPPDTPPDEAAVAPGGTRRDPSTRDEEVEIIEPALMWRRSHEAAVLSIAGVLPVLPAGQLDARRTKGFGFDLQFLAAGRGWPVLLGLGGGNLYLKYSSKTQWEDWHWEGDWPFEDVRYTKGSTTTTHSTELRHAEVLVRFQPWWGRVRPYVETAFGLSVLWQGMTVDSEVVRAKRSAAVLYAATLGVDVQVLSRRDVIVLSVGARHLRTGPLRQHTYVANAAGEIVRRSHRESLALWAPFVALSIAY